MYDKVQFIRGYVEFQMTICAIVQSTNKIVGRGRMKWMQEGNMFFKFSRNFHQVHTRTQILLLELN